MKKQTGKKSDWVFVILLAAMMAIVITGCGIRHSRCMSYYYRDVQLGIAH
jgi:hypothetical protein